MKRQEAVEVLLKSYAAYFNISRFEDDGFFLAARCDFFEHSQKYVLSRKAELWSTDSEEFLYLFNVPKLDLETLNACQKRAYEDGMSRLNIGPGHMYSFITAVFLCDSCDDDARKALKKTRIYKSFHFSLHGWMDYHTVVVSFDDNRIDSNYSGRSTAKIMKKILFHKKEKEK
ncbi:MAG: hypothetical protein NC086_03050 [Alistipes sp.]|nr:hypothetical protein [Alistipes sp.]